jgi:hypothetical protein
MNVICSHHLELRNKDGSLMAFVSTGLPSHIRSALEMNLSAALEKQDLLGEADTRLSGSPFFQAMHLSWYNRHCTKVSHIRIFASTVFRALVLIY